VVRKLLSERPVLVGGVGLAAGLGLLGVLHEIALDGATVLSLVAAGAAVWWWRRQPSTASTAPKPVTPVERVAVETALKALQPLLETLRRELGATDRAADLTGIALEALETRRQDLFQALDRTTLQIAIAGATRTGKTTLAEHLTHRMAEAPEARFEVTECALTAETNHPEAMLALQLHQDAVIYLVTEDLTDSALTDIKELSAAGQCVLLCLNKQDHYLPDDRALVIERMQSRLRVLPQTVPVVAIATAPKPMKVRTHTATGEVQERLEAQDAAIAPVTQAVSQWTTQITSHLVTQTVMRQTHQLRRDIQTALNQVRRRKALPQVEQLQWAAAATAFASPVPSLDLLATIAVNGQLVMDLGRAYHQPLSLDHAQEIAKELAAIVIKLGLVELSTQLLTTTLKSHAATYVVGGGVQAFSAAYLTRLCGESLMAYFEARALAGQTDTTLSVSAIGQKLQALLPQTQRADFLKGLVKQGVQKLSHPPTPALTAGTTPAVDLSSAAPMAIAAPADSLSSREPA